MLSSTAEARTANIGIDTRWTGTPATAGSLYIGQQCKPMIDKLGANLEPSFACGGRYDDQHAYVCVTKWRTFLFNLRADVGSHLVQQDCNPFFQLWCAEAGGIGYRYAVNLHCLRVPHGHALG